MFLDSAMLAWSDDVTHAKTKITSTLAHILTEYFVEVCEFLQVRASFCKNYLARSANVPEGLYILPMFFLYFLFIFNGRLSSTRSSDANGVIFTKISGLVDGCKGLLTSLSFFWFFKGRCHGNQSRKIGVFLEPITFIAMPFGNGMG